MSRFTACPFIFSPASSCLFLCNIDCNCPQCLCMSVYPLLVNVVSVHSLRKTSSLFSSVPSPSQSSHVQYTKNIPSVYFPEPPIHPCPQGVGRERNVLSFSFSLLKSVDSNFPSSLSTSVFYPEEGLFFHPQEGVDRGIFYPKESEGILRNLKEWLTRKMRKWERTEGRIGLKWMSLLFSRFFVSRSLITSRPSRIESILFEVSLQRLQPERMHLSFPCTDGTLMEDRGRGRFTTSPTLLFPSSFMRNSFSPFHVPFTGNLWVSLIWIFLTVKSSPKLREEGREETTWEWEDIQVEMNNDSCSSLRFFPPRGLSRFSSSLVSLVLEVRFSFPLHPSSRSRITPRQEKHSQNQEMVQILWIEREAHEERKRTKLKKDSSIPLTWITRMFNPVSAASCSRICLVGLGVWLKAFFRVSSCFALIVVLGPLRLVPGVFSSFPAPPEEDDPPPVAELLFDAGPFAPPVVPPGVDPPPIDPFDAPGELTP